MTRGIKSFRSGAILIALVLLGAAIFTMAAREQANLSASYSFLNAYDSNGAMLSPTPTAVVNDLSTSQLGAFNLGVGAEWTTVGPYFGIDMTSATGAALTSANTVKTAFDALPTQPTDRNEVPVAFEVVFTATRRDQNAPIAGIGSSLSLDADGLSMMCDEAPFYLFQDRNLIILKIRKSGPGEGMCANLAVANIETIPVTSPISILVSSVVDNGWRNVTLTINGGSVSTPRYIRSSFLPMGVADLDYPLSAGLANPLGQRWQGSIHYMGVYAGVHINGATGRSNTATLLPLQPPLFSASLRQNGLVVDEFSTSVVPVRSAEAFTVHPDAQLALSLTSATTKFWECYNVTAIRAGASAAETLTSSASLPFAVADKTSLTFRSIESYSACAGAAKELAVMAQVTLPPTSARAATTQTDLLLSAPWAAPRAIPFAVLDASSPVATAATSTMVARSARWLDPLTGTNADPSLTMTQATITSLPNPQFRLFTWNEERARSLGVAYVDGSADAENPNYWTPITSVPFVISATDSSFVMPRGETIVTKSIKVAVRHTANNAAPTTPTSPASVIATAAFDYTIKSSNGRTSQPATVTVNVGGWISCASSSLEVMPNADYVFTANAQDLSLAPSSNIGTPEYVSMVITRLPTMGTLQVPLTPALSAAAAAAEAEAEGVSANFQPLAAPADAAGAAAQRKRLLRLLSKTRSPTAALHELTGYAAHTAEVERRGIVAPAAGAATPVTRALTVADLPYATAGNTIIYRPQAGVLSRLSAPATAAFDYFVFDRRFSAPSENSATASLTLTVIATAPQLYVQTSDRGAPESHLTATLTMPYADEASAVLVNGPTSLNLTYTDSDEGDNSARIVEVAIACPSTFTFGTSLPDAEWEALVLNTTDNRSFFGFTVRHGNLQEALSSLRIDFMQQSGSTVRVTMTATEHGEHGDRSTSTVTFYARTDESKMASSAGDFFSGIIFKLILFIAVPIVGILVLVALCKLLKRRICGAKTEAEKACDAADAEARGETSGSAAAATAAVGSNMSKHIADGSKKDKKDAKKKNRSPSISESHASYVSPYAPGAASSSMSLGVHPHAAVSPYYVSPGASLGLMCNTALPPYPGCAAGSNNSSPTFSARASEKIDRPMTQEELTATMAMLLRQQMSLTSSGQFPADPSSSASMSFGRGGYDGPVPEALDARDAHTSVPMHMQYTARPGRVPGSPEQSFTPVPGSPNLSLPDTPTAMRRSLKTGKIMYNKTYAKKKVARKL